MKLDPFAAESGVLVEVLEEHIEEIEFGLTQFERALADPVQTLSELARYPEERLLAHLDALAVTGEAAQRRLVSVLTEPDADAPVRLCAAALGSISAGHGKELLPLLGHDMPAMRSAVARALALSTDPEVERWVMDRWATRRSPSERSGLLEVIAERGMAVPPLAGAALRSDDPWLIASAVRAVRQGPARTFLPTVEGLLTHDQAAVRDAALVTALGWGSAPALAACERWALDESRLHPLAMSLYAALGARGQHALLARMLAAPAARGQVLFALGFAGSVTLVPQLLPILRDTNLRHAKLAAQAIALITGLDLAASEFVQTVEVAPIEGELPPVEDDPEALAALPPLEEDDLDADLVPPPEDALPIPTADAFEAYWRDNEARFDPAVRYLNGVPVSDETLLRELTTSAPLQRRHVLALWLAIRTRGALWVNTRAFTERQYAQLRAGIPGPK